MAIWCILRPVNGQLEYFVVIWYIFPFWGIFSQDKSGNPVSNSATDFFPAKKMCLEELHVPSGPVLAPLMRSQR
jgi:hypothetical protein